MATNSTWYTAFAALSVSGVKRHYDEPPQAISTADLPALYIQAPGGSMPGWTVSCRASNKTRSITVVILVEPVGQGTNKQTFAASPALADALETALDALTVTNFIEYDLTIGAGVEIAGIVYWAIVATVRGRDL
jgi:hypothetical protein